MKENQKTYKNRIRNLMQPLQNPSLWSNTKIEQDISRILNENKISVLSTFLSLFRKEGGLFLCFCIFLK
jgi:hypothetical protein